MKIFIALFIIATLTGCAQFAQEKLDRYKDAAYMAGNPERIEVEYSRNGNEASFYECRCSGSMCAKLDSSEQ